MRRLLAMTCLACLATASATAAQYQLILHEAPAELAKRTDTGPAGQAYWKGFAAYGEALQAAGILRGGGAVYPSAQARIVRDRSGSSEVQPLPATAGKAEYGGWFLVDVSTADEAHRWAAKAPSVASGGWVEVRPLYPVPGMAGR